MKDIEGFMNKAQAYMNARTLSEACDLLYDNLQPDIENKSDLKTAWMAGATCLLGTLGQYQFPDGIAKLKSLGEEASNYQNKQRSNLVGKAAESILKEAAKKKRDSLDRN